MDMETWSSDSLRAFEADIANLFNIGEIRAPIHLSDGNEIQMIEIFQEIKDDDWVFCSWRSHYQCLLKGVPASRVQDEILAGRSISLCFPDFKIYSSAIVGGQLPLAVGAALSLKRKELPGHVWCFIGDMTSETGIAQTAIRYSERHKLPITFIIEDNGISVLTETRTVWNSSTLRFEEIPSPNVRSYKYKSKYPHAGAGVRVQF
jgi:TPP-dependent pyruvate/acetoin dehydrogenase alpha subunit